jgi:hypothetical protein
MSPADAMFSYGLCVWMNQTNAPVVLLDPGINGTASLPNVNLTTRQYIPEDSKLHTRRHENLKSPMSEVVFSCCWREVIMGQSSDKLLCLTQMRPASVKTRCCSPIFHLEVGYFVTLELTDMESERQRHGRSAYIQIKLAELRTRWKLRLTAHHIYFALL